MVSKDYFKFLPSQITVNILSRVPTELVLECKLVCKTWNYLVSHNPSFSKMHVHHHLNQAAAHSGKMGFLALTKTAAEIDPNSIPQFHYFEYNINQGQSTTPIQRIKKLNLATPFQPHRFIGSINGLICFSRFTLRRSHELVCIYNPITKEYSVLPIFQTDYPCPFWTTVFGYVSSTNEYKVVGVILEKEFTSVYIYTLGSGTGWRNLGNFNFGLSVYHLEQASFANGALYFMCSDESGTILSFDLSGEKFCGYVSPPPLPPQEKNYWRHNRIGVLDGFLYFAIVLVVRGVPYYDIWFLRNKNSNHGMKEREEKQSWYWSKEFMVQMTGVLAVPKSDTVLTYRSPNITEALVGKTVMEFQKGFCRVLPHENTFVSLRKLGE